MKNQIKKVEIDGREEWLLDGQVLDRFQLLAIASRCDCKDTAWEVMKVASILYHPLDDPTFNTLYGCVALELARTHRKDEFYYRRLFKENYSKIRPGEVVNNKTDGANTPDAWVVKKGHLIPVEVKRGEFNGKALEQLRRYMKAYSSDAGIAVAGRLTTKLPPNVEFISLAELEGA